MVPCEENPLPVSELEIDEFQFHYTTSERPHIQNDTITINHRFANDHIIKLSISHALSQVGGWLLPHRNASRQMRKLAGNHE